MHKKFKSKERVEHGIKHKTLSGKTIEKKKITLQVNCTCKKECALRIDAARQLDIFTNYYNDFNWSQKTQFIRQMVKMKPVKQKKSVLFPVIALKNRNFSFDYGLLDDDSHFQRVCRSFFLRCLQVSPKRIHGALHSQINNPGARENRGRSTSKNKISETDLNNVRRFIESLSQYHTAILF